MKTDSQIQADVIQELSWDPSVTHEHVGITAANGVVTLTGNVPSYAEKYAAERAVQRVAGVKAVVEKIEVKLPSMFIRDDSDIAEAILNQFKWSIQVPDRDVKVTVENGWVTLKGEVDWAFQRNAAERCVHEFTGVKGVINNVTIKAKSVQTDKVKQKIEEALKREAGREAKQIAVEISGSKVILSGDVRTFSEMEEAKWAAWSAPGVTTVENRMNVNSRM